jgi:hypothetical protein
MKKPFPVSGIIIAIIFLVLVMVFLFVDFEAPALGNEVLEKAHEITGINLKAAKFRLNLGRGLIWEDVEASSRFPGGRYSLQIERMVLEHRLLPLLAGTIVVRRVVLEKPRIEVSGNRPSPNPEPRSRDLPERGESTIVDKPTARSKSSRLDLALVVSDIQLNEATVTLTGSQPSQAGLSIQELHVGLRNLSVSRGALTLLHALTATGEVRARRFAMETARARDLKGALVLDRGRVELRDLAFTTDSGTFVSGVKVDFNRIPVGYAMNLEGGPLDVQLLASLGEGEGLGAGHLELGVEGFGGSSKNIRGEGVLRLEPGKLPAHPILMGIEKALGAEGFVGSPYGETEVHFQIRDDQLILEQFHLETDQAASEVSGVILHDGSFDLSLVVRRPREGSNVKERFHLTGSLKEPHIER